MRRQRPGPNGHVSSESRPLHPGFGVELVHPPQSPEELAAAAIEQVARHRVLLIRDRPRSIRFHLRLAAAMGTVGGVTGRKSGLRRPAVRRERAPGSFTEHWHADQSWSTCPDVLSLLICTQAGVNPDPTQFADTSLAYGRLSPDLRRELQGLEAHHHVAASRRSRYDHREQRSSLARVYRAVAWGQGSVHRLLTPRGTAIRAPEATAEPGVRHPVLGRDDATGRPFVRLGDHAWKISDLEEPRSIELVGDINRRIVDADNILTHRWLPGDLLVYDNRMILHRRLITGKEGSDRTLRRVMIWTQRQGDPFQHRTTHGKIVS